MIKCIDIYKEYKTGNEQHKVLDGISLDVTRGEFVAVNGKSGSGKSTLLNLIGLIDTATSGVILIDGIDINSLSAKNKANIRNKKIGFVFQSFYLEPSYEVYKNIEIPLIIRNIPVKERKKRVEECLQKVDMSDKYSAYTNTLSGGEMQRVSIARALANKPELILADEPCGNLDSLNSENIMKILVSLKNEGKTIIMVTHSNEEAAQADRIVTLKDGRIINDEC